MDRKFLKCIVGFILILGLAGSGCGDAQQDAPRSTGLMQGQVAPDFTLPDLEGRQTALSSFKDSSPVCLVFWATWCPYCIQEVPKLKKIYDNYAGKGLKVLAINVATNDPLERVMAFQKKSSIAYPILYDAAGTVSRMYGVMGIPVSVIIDRNGVIKYRGYTLPENYEQLFAQLL